MLASLLIFAKVCHATYKCIKTHHALYLIDARCGDSSRDGSDVVLAPSHHVCSTGQTMLWLALARPCVSTRTFLESFVLLLENDRCTKQRRQKQEFEVVTINLFNSDESASCTCRWVAAGGSSAMASKTPGMQGPHKARGMANPQTSESSPKIKQRLAKKFQS